MADITKDASTSAEQGSGTTHTISFTVGNNSDRMLMVHVMDVNDVSTLVTGVTFNGESLTKLSEERRPSARVHTLWYLIAPAVGTYNVVVSTSASTYTGVNIVSWYNVRQTSNPTNTNDVTASGTTTFSPTVTVTESNSMVIAGVGSGSAITAGTDTTNVETGVDAGATIVARSSNMVSSGTTTLNFSKTGSSNWVAIMSVWAASGSPRRVFNIS